MKEHNGFKVGDRVMYALSFISEYPEYWRKIDQVGTITGFQPSILFQNEVAARIAWVAGIQTSTITQHLIHVERTHLEPLE